ncbi:hypothetical protein AYI68_g1022 [Smittium mucronatum]|uniref:Uncharacterized protein n=1 Tax=Smittium mucronatum TaxID=133383 RepID=A0A1R0H6T5_9FUNG|nr:hypothetical protein AYI68_g1022 [Smittium mucronatum]
MDQEEKENAVVDFWKKFYIKNPIDIIYDLWALFISSCLRCVQKNIMPWIGITNFENLSQRIINLKLDCFEICDILGLGYIGISDVDEVLEHKEYPK